MGFFGAVRASLWRTPARSGRLSLRPASSVGAQALAPWPGLADASGAEKGHRVGRSRRNFPVRFGFRPPGSNERTRSFLMEGQT